MVKLQREVDTVAHDTGFSGVISVDRGGEVELAGAYGLAHRGYAIPNTLQTRFGIASGTKGLTALVIVSLIERGDLELATTARSVLGDDLPLIDDAVTVEQLLAHRSGIGDYLDEDGRYDVTDYAIRVPLHELADTEGFLAALDGFTAKFAPGQQFSYCNGGYMVLALIAERVSATPFHQLVHERVCAPAGMASTEFLRLDELPGDAATGYLGLDTDRTNVLHLPVRGNGDGGIFSTVDDISRLWAGLFAGRIVTTTWVEEMVRPRSDVPAESNRYGLGFWLHAESDVVMLAGLDAGVSFRSVHDPASRLTHTVISNATDGAWPISRLLIGELAT